jgi:hypothetical protein
MAINPCSLALLPSPCSCLSSLQPARMASTLVLFLLAPALLVPAPGNGPPAFSYRLCIGIAVPIDAVARAMATAINSRSADAGCIFRSAPDPAGVGGFPGRSGSAEGTSCYILCIRVLRRCRIQILRTYAVLGSSKACDSLSLGRQAQRRNLISTPTCINMVQGFVPGVLPLEDKLRIHYISPLVAGFHLVSQCYTKCLLVPSSH